MRSHTSSKLHGSMASCSVAGDAPGRHVGVGDADAVVRPNDVLCGSRGLRLCPARSRCRSPHALLHPCIVGARRCRGCFRHPHRRRRHGTRRQRYSAGQDLPVRVGALVGKLRVCLRLRARALLWPCCVVSSTNLRLAEVQWALRLQLCCCRLSALLLLRQTRTLARACAATVPGTKHRIAEKQALEVRRSWYCW